MTINHRYRSSPAFTIVELLVVIVVIGILAAITIVSYSGITSKATIASLQSDLDNSSRLLKMYQVEHSAYPTSFDANNCPLGATAPSPDTKYCIKPNSGNTYTYKISATNSNIFCLTSTKGTQSYNISPDTQPLAGLCPVLSLDAGNSLSYPGAGNNKWYDLSGNDNDGVLNGGVSYSPVNGGVMSFDGVSGYVSLGNLPTNFTGGITISSWVYPTSTNNWSRFADFGNGAQNDNIVFARNGISNNIYYEVKNGTASGASVQAPVIELNKWQCFSVSEDNQGNVSLYKNGLPVAYGITNIPNNVTRVSNFIGRSNWAADSYYTGSVSDFTLYDRGLSQAEIQQNFNILRGRYGL